MAGYHVKTINKTTANLSLHTEAEVFFWINQCIIKNVKMEGGDASVFIVLWKSNQQCLKLFLSAKFEKHHLANINLFLATLKLQLDCHEIWYTLTSGRIVISLVTPLTFHQVPSSGQHFYLLGFMTK